MRDLEQLKVMFESFHEAVYIVDTERKILYFNPVASEISGFKSSELVGSHCFDNTLNHVDDSGKNLCRDGCPLLVSIKENKVSDHFVYLHHKFGHRVRVHVRSIPYLEDGKVVGAIEVFTDETQRTSMIDELIIHKHMAMLDPLTGLFNRRFLSDRFPSMLSENAKEGMLGILFMDIDNFKAINDTFGHLAGDEVLKSIASTIQYNLKTHDYVIRYGGEEIIAFLKNVNPEDLLFIAEKLRILVMKSSTRTSRHELSVTISVGATMILPNESIEEGIHRADIAMYEAKVRGKNQTVVQ
jgi:diguanylate cyclase (GGDEF)-like protein/PAS domain S-box-containing protein